MTAKSSRSPFWLFVCAAWLLCDVRQRNCPRLSTNARTLLGFQLVGIHATDVGLYFEWRTLLSFSLGACGRLCRCLMECLSEAGTCGGLIHSILTYSSPVPGSPPLSAARPVSFVALSSSCSCLSVVVSLAFPCEKTSVDVRILFCVAHFLCGGWLDVIVLRCDRRGRSLFRNF